MDEETKGTAAEQQLPLMGVFHHNVDGKNRLFIPAKHRDILGASFIICPSIRDKSLKAYSLSEWNKYIAPIEKLDRKYQEMLKKESEMEKMRANLLRAVSHDFRTPLTTIYGASSALIESGSEFTDEQKEKMLRGIQQDSQWLYRMVENLLSITRLDGDIKLIKTPIALDELIDSVLIKFAKRYPDQEVEVNLPDELVIIPMDAILIEQVIINILENAVQHAEGMKKLALNVKCDGDRVVFEVQDDGDGIPEDRLKHLFDGSLLGDSSDEVSVDCRQRRNAGIGLSVCATIIKAHGGDISAYNSAEGGAVFRFTLKIEEVTYEQ